MFDLLKKFQKEKFEVRGGLIAATVAFVSVFLPWVSIGLGAFGSATVAGISVFGGWLTLLASAGMVGIWLLPRLDVKLDFKFSDEQARKILAIVMLVGPLLLLLQARINFSIFGFGWWVGVIAGATAAFFAFKK